MKDSPNFLYIHNILLIKSPSNFPIYQRDSPNFYTYKYRGVLKIIPADDIPFSNLFWKNILNHLNRPSYHQFWVKEIYTW